MIPPQWRELRGQKFFILITLDCWKRHFREKNYIENYFYLLKSTKSTKTTSQKCWRNIIWMDFLGHPYHTNSIKIHLGLPVTFFWFYDKIKYAYFIFYRGAFFAKTVNNFYLLNIFTKSPTINLRLCSKNISAASLMVLHDFI